MAWNDLQASGTVIDYDEWNSMASYIIAGHYSGASNWDKQKYHNSSLIWDYNLMKWKATKSGGSTGTGTLAGNMVGNIYGVNTYGIDDLKFISSQNISSTTITTGEFVVWGNTISGLTWPHYPSSAANRKYVDTVSGNIIDKIGTGTLVGDMGGYIHGNSFQYGIDELASLSSQIISGGAYKHIFIPATYTIGRDGTTYFSRRGRDGTIVMASTVASDVLNYTFSLCGQGKTTTTRHKGSGSVSLLTNVNLTKTVSGAWNTDFNLNGHTIYVNGNFPGIKMYGGFNIHHGRLSFQNSSVPVSKTTPLILFYGSASNMNARCSLPPTAHDLYFRGWSETLSEYLTPYWFSGTAVSFFVERHGVSDEILASTLYNLFFNYFTYGVRMYTSDTCAINATYANQLYFNWCHYGIYMSGNETLGASSLNNLEANFFDNCHFQTRSDDSYPNTWTWRHIFIGRNTRANYIFGYIWDTDTDVPTLIELADAGTGSGRASRSNTIVTNIGGSAMSKSYIDDNGINNLVESTAGYRTSPTFTHPTKIFLGDVSCNRLYCSKIYVGDTTLDPAAMVFNYETRDEIKNMIGKEISEYSDRSKRGAIMYFNGESQKIELYLPCSNKFTDLMGNEI